MDPVPPDLRPALDCPEQSAVVRTEIEHGAEPVVDIVEAIHDAVGYLAMQEVDAAAPR